MADEKCRCGLSRGAPVHGNPFGAGHAFVPDPRFRDKLAEDIDGHAPNLGPRDPARPDVWFVWCACGWEGGTYAEDHAHRYRLHVADALITGAIAAEVEARVQASVNQRAAEAWDRGYVAGHSNAMRRMSDEPNTPTSRNPYDARAAVLDTEGNDHE